MIEFQNVRFVHQNNTVALDGVNLNISLGELVSVVGENGAGKTTLIRHVNGLLKPTSGEVKVFGENTRSVSVARLSRRVGIIFQNADHQLFSDSVEKEITFGLKNFGFDESAVKEKTDQVLSYLGLERYRKLPPMMLSGGEKKRLCLAAVLAWDPDVLILDEPTVGQDAHQKAKLEAIIMSLIKRGKTVIIVTHDLEFIWPLQPRILVMASGRILADGPISTVLAEDGILGQANLVKPQLLHLSQLLMIKPFIPFKNVDEAQTWIAARVCR